MIYARNNFSNISNYEIFSLLIKQTQKQQENQHQQNQFLVKSLVFNKIIMEISQVISIINDLNLDGNIDFESISLISLYVMTIKKIINILSCTWLKNHVSLLNLEESKIILSILFLNNSHLKKYFYSLFQHKSMMFLMKFLLFLFSKTKIVSTGRGLSKKNMNNKFIYVLKGKITIVKGEVIRRIVSERNYSFYYFKLEYFRIWFYYKLDYPQYKPEFIKKTIEKSVQEKSVFQKLTNLVYLTNFFNSSIQNDDFNRVKNDYQIVEFSLSSTITENQYWTNNDHSVIVENKENKAEYYKQNLYYMVYNDNKSNDLIEINNETLIKSIKDFISHTSLIYYKLFTSINLFSFMNQNFFEKSIFPKLGFLEMSLKEKIIPKEKTFYLVIEGVIKVEFKFTFMSLLLKIVFLYERLKSSTKLYENYICDIENLKKKKHHQKESYYKEVLLLSSNSIFSGSSIENSDLTILNTCEYSEIVIFDTQEVYDNIYNADMKIKEKLEEEIENINRKNHIKLLKRLEEIYVIQSKSMYLLGNFTKIDNKSNKYPLKKDVFPISPTYLSTKKTNFNINSKEFLDGNYLLNYFDERNEVKERKVRRDTKEKKDVIINKNIHKSLVLPVIRNKISLELNINNK